MKIFTTIILSLLVCLNLYADITPEIGYTSIKIKKTEIGGTDYIGYQYCTPTEGCVQVGERKFYSLSNLQEQYTKEQNQNIATWILDPILTIVGTLVVSSAEIGIMSLVKGGEYIPSAFGTNFGIFGGIAGFSGGLVLAKIQSKDPKAMMLRKQDIIVKDDAAIATYLKRLKVVLKKLN